VKLFVYCPEEHHGVEDSKEWQAALALSKKNKLPIVSNIEEYSHVKKARVISVPEKSFSNIDKTVKLGFIQRIDITDEFFEFSSSTRALITDCDDCVLDYKPTVKEAHKVKFRIRHHKKGMHKVVVMDEVKVYLEESFEVL